MLPGAVGARASALVVPRGIQHDTTTGATSYTIDTRNLGEAQREFAADGGYVRLRNGFPEVVVAQLDAFDDARVTKAIVVRFDPHRFKERATGFESFLAKLKETFEGDAKRRTLPGTFVQVLRAARSEGAQSALVHAEFEMPTFSGGSGYLLFLTLPGASARSIANKNDSKVHFIVEVECAMSAPALADLLDAWRELADTL